MSKETTADKAAEKRRTPGDEEAVKDADEKATEGLDYCIQPGNPEAVRHNEDEDDACDPGRAGTFEKKLD